MYWSAVIVLPTAGRVSHLEPHGHIEDFLLS